MVAEWGAEAWDARVGLLRALSQAVTGWAEYASDEVNGTAAAPDPAIASAASAAYFGLAYGLALLVVGSIVFAIWRVLTDGTEPLAPEEDPPRTRHRQRIRSEPPPGGAE